MDLPKVCGNVTRNRILATWYMDFKGMEIDMRECKAMISKMIDDYTPKRYQDDLAESRRLEIMEPKLNYGCTIL